MSHNALRIIGFDQGCKNSIYRSKIEFSYDVMWTKLTTTDQQRNPKA